MMNENDDDNPWLNPSSDKESSSQKSDSPNSKFKFKDADEASRLYKSHQKRNMEENLLEQIGEYIKKFKSKTNSRKPPPSSSNLFVVLAIFIVLIWFASGFYRVQEGELAVVLRFGELNRISHAGLRYRLPYPFEEEIIRRVDVLNKIDSSSKSMLRDSREDSDQTLILTGDENVVHTNYTVLWKIRDITEFLFTSSAPESTIIVAAESAIREVLGQTTARLVLTEGRGIIGTQAQNLLQQILDSYKIGVQIVSVQLQRVEPPSQVIKAFNDMQASLVDADRLKNEAEAYANEKLPNARAIAEKTLQEAQGYQEKTILLAKGEAERFAKVLKSYKMNPDLTKRKSFLETLQSILSKIDNKTILDSKISSGIMPYLNLKSPLSLKKGEQ